MTPLLFFCFSVTQTPSALIPPEIENPKILGINKIPYHSILMPYGSYKEAVAADRKKSSFALSLNGPWRFNWVKRPELRQADFFTTGFDDRKWTTISVPSNVEVLGYGTPYYKNNGFVFKPDWPRVMSEPPKDYTAYDERNPVSSYRRTFTVPSTWQKRQTFLTFYGVDAGFFLWINGKKVGYSQNSRNAAEFDISKFIHPGQNRVAVEVYRFTVGSYFEDQDMFRLSGIFRDVVLWSAPKLHVQDTFITTDLDSQYRNATLNLRAKIHNYDTKLSSPTKLTVDLLNSKGALVGTTETAIGATSASGERIVILNLKVHEPAKWTAETPNLYTAVIRLGEDKEFISHKVGFRKVEIKGRVFMVNGVPVKLKGANRHEMDPNTGHTVTEAQMIRDLQLLKGANCNHVRTSHYTNDPRWYELCDEWGIYLVGEANAESHGAYNILSNDARFEQMVVDRNVANVENMKNHPSVLIWSLGNENGDGTNFRSALKTVEKLDPTRPTHYQSFGAGSNNPASVDSEMYTDVPSVERIATSNRFTKPFYLCEYAHAMNNSMGSIGDYNDLFDKYPALMGGAVWEWQDQGLWNRRDPKHVLLAYGGGFGEKPNDGYFIHKGVVFSDRTPKPHYPEMKRAYQWVSFTDLSDGKVRLKNRYAFLNLNQFDLKWTVVSERGVVGSGSSHLPSVLPGAELTIEAPSELVQAINGKADPVKYLNWAVTLRKPEKWAKVGTEIANAQFGISSGTPVKAEPPTGNLTVNTLSNGDISVKGATFSVVFGHESGTINSLAANGKEVLLTDGGPKLHLWRAQHRNDDGWAAGGWHNAGLDKLSTRVLSINASKVGSSTAQVSISTKYIGYAGFSVHHLARYTVYADGRIAVDNAVSPNGPNIALARVGVRMLLKPSLENLSYFARGPMENYSDRKRGSDIGYYSSTVTAQLTPYEKPQEGGNHEDMRWIVLGGTGMPTLRVSAEATPLQFSALPYRDEDMEDVAYRVDLPKRNATVLIVSAKTLGVGSAACGPRPQPQYRVDCTPTRFSYVLSATEDPKVGADVSAPDRSGSLPLATAKSNGTVQLLGDPSIEISDDGQAWGTPQAGIPATEPHAIWVRSGSFVGKLELEAVPAKSTWTATANSYERGEGEPEHVLDNDSSTIWHSRWSSNKAEPPHSLTINLKKDQEFRGVSLLPRQDGNGNGRIKEYEIYASEDGKDWGQPIAKGTLRNSGSRQSVRLNSNIKAHFIQIRVLSDWSGEGFASLAELDIEK